MAASGRCWVRNPDLGAHRSPAGGAGATQREECAQLDAYHARVLAKIGPDAPGDVAAWLEGACAPV